MRKLLLIVVLSLALAVPAFAADDAFTKVDADKSGKIDKKEFSGAVSKNFDRLDKDRNGYLDREEFKAVGPGSEELFNELDVNKDGKISKDEFAQGAAKRFDFLDKDKNGYLDRNEFSAPDPKKGRFDKETPAVRPFLNFYF